MTESTWSSWQESLGFLRGLHAVPAALANATTLLAARHRWSRHVVARTSMHDLLFTLPGKDPFGSTVRVKSAAGTSTISRTRGDTLVEDAVADAEDVDRSVDEALEWLSAPARICRRCGDPVVANAEQFDVFERMHWTCFHHEFEHGITRSVDPDEDCGLAGCPSGPGFTDVAEDWSRVEALARQVAAARSARWLTIQFDPSDEQVPWSVAVDEGYPVTDSTTYHAATLNAALNDRLHQ